MHRQLHPRHTHTRERLYSQSCHLPSPFPALRAAPHRTQRLSRIRTAAARLTVATLVLGCTLYPPLVTEQSHFVSPAVKALAADTKVHGSRKGKQWRSDFVGGRRQGARGSASGLKAALTCPSCRWRATCRLARAYRHGPESHSLRARIMAKRERREIRPASYAAIKLLLL